MGDNRIQDSTDSAPIKVPRAGDETAEVMVTVKTYPNPSETYGETVCVAGVRLDRGHPEWIRLYPVKFRNTDFDRQFRKYEIIRINGTYHQANDNRPESFRPRQDELQHVALLSPRNNWHQRRTHLNGLIGDVTMCGLLERNPLGGMGTPSPSLGLIKPTDIETSIVDGNRWTALEQAKIDRASAPDLFGTSLLPLQPAPFSVRYKYRCAAVRCKGHRHDQKVLDWEAGQAARRWLRQYGPADAKRALLKKWRDQILDADNDIHFYVGNQNRHRRSFSVLGTWYPKIEDALF